MRLYCSACSGTENCRQAIIWEDTKMRNQNEERCLTTDEEAAMISPIEAKRLDA